MNHALGLLMLLVLPTQAQTPGLKASKIKLTARAERPNALYKVKEQVTFDIALLDQGKPMAKGELTYVLTKDGLPTDREGKAIIVDGKAVVQGKLTEPGFLQLRVSYRGDPADRKAAPVTALAGAGIDVDLIKPSAPVPHDFDAFWAEQKKKLAAVQVNAQLTPAPSPSSTIAIFDVQADCLGAPVSGYLAKPIAAKPKSLPIIMTVHGAGVNSSSLGGASLWAAKGFIAMDMNAHGLPNGKPPEYYKNLYATTMKHYRFEGRDSREKSYFTGMFLRLVRALDVLTAQPEWDGKTVVVFGSSQGGYQAIVAAGLDSRVTFFCAGVPAGCDHTGMLANRIAGWPKLVPNGPDGKPDARVLEASRYVDAVNFATRTKANGCFFTVGFVDGTCPPTSVYAAYNAAPIAKTIFNDVVVGHVNSPAATAAMVKAAVGHAAAQAVK